jgi:hypothetical protein
MLSSLSTLKMSILNSHSAPHAHICTLSILICPRANAHTHHRPRLLLHMSEDSFKIHAWSYRCYMWGQWHDHSVGYPVPQHNKAWYEDILYYTMPNKYRARSQRVTFKPVLYTYVPATGSTGSDMGPPVLDLDIIRLQSGIRTWKEERESC